MPSILQMLPRGVAALLAVTTTAAAQTPAAPAPPPLKVLLVAGGCSHDYGTRVKILVQGIRERIVRPMEWVVRLEGVGESDSRIPLFESSEWAKGYDLVVHDHCFPRVHDPAYIDRVLAPHRAGTPAVLIHGTMLSFRTGDQRWFEFTGATIRGHEPERPVRVEPLPAADPILKGFQPWLIAREELYRVDSLAPGASALLEARALPPASFPTSDLRPLASAPKHPVTWTHRFGPAGARVFASTLGNASAILADPVSLDGLARGVLWSLGIPEEGALRTVPPGESLKGLALPAASAPLLRPGRNVTWQGTATGFQWGQAKAGEGAGLVHDGDPFTAWVPPGKGPGWWEVRWMPEKPVSLAAVWWELPIPAEAVLEGTRDGRTWIPLATLTPPAETERPVLARFESRTLTGLRLSVPRTAPGQGFALREVAAYASEDELPSAILAATPDPPGLVRLRTAGDGALAGIRLAPGWRVEAFDSTGLQGTPGQMLPTASGALFLSVFPGGDAPGRVHRIERNPRPGGPERPGEPFLSGLAPDTRIAWDGEWLYTLSGFRLDRVRKALGTGPADERQALGEPLRPPAEGAPTGFAWTDFRLGEDGWLHGRYQTTLPGSLLRPDGQPIRLEREGWVRFRRDGSGAVASPGMAANSVFEGIAGIEGALLGERDGPRIWFVTREADGLKLGCLRSDSAGDPARTDLDAAPTGQLSGHLGPHAGGAVNLEIALEFTRRRDASIPELKGLLAAGTAPSLAGPLVAALAALPPERARPHLIELATAPDAPPAVRAAAFRALGDLEGELDPEVFRDLGSVTDPSVTAAIFEGMRRRAATLPGAARVALRLAHHPDPGLARAAFSFLRDRGGVEAAFAALDAPECREDWPRAFDLLSEFPVPAVVDGILGRLATASDPELRRGWLRTLGRLRILPNGDRWTKTGEIETRLLEALGDDRVDRVDLIDSISNDSFIIRDQNLLFTLARKVPGLENWAIERLAPSGSGLPAEVSDWLTTVANDPDRDEALRRRAGALARSKDALPPDRPASPPVPSTAPTSPKVSFRREGCAVCHNLDGEGPAAGPDLVALMAALPTSDRPGKLANPGASGWSRLVTADGRAWTLWIEGRGEKGRVDGIDRAGNRFQLPESAVVGEPRALEASESPCSAASAWPPADRSALLDLLSRYAEP
jgi:type 1 glutamine amidotransferase/mono/diheme cytochrome c family protein